MSNTQAIIPIGPAPGADANEADSARARADAEQRAAVQAWRVRMAARLGVKPVVLDALAAQQRREREKSDALRTSAKEFESTQSKEQVTRQEVLRADAQRAELLGDETRGAAHTQDGLSAEARRVVATQIDAPAVLPPTQASPPNATAATQLLEHMFAGFVNNADGKPLRVKDLRAAAAAHTEQQRQTQVQAQPSSGNVGGNAAKQASSPTQKQSQPQASSSGTTPVVFSLDTSHVRWDLIMTKFLKRSQVDMDVWRHLLKRMRKDARFAAMDGVKLQTLLKQLDQTTGRNQAVQKVMGEYWKLVEAPTKDVMNKLAGALSINIDDIETQGLRQNLRSLHHVFAQNAKIDQIMTDCLGPDAARDLAAVGPQGRVVEPSLAQRHVLANSELVALRARRPDMATAYEKHLHDRLHEGGMISNRELYANEQRLLLAYANQARVLGRDALADAFAARAAEFDSQIVQCDSEIYGHSPAHVRDARDEQRIGFVHDTADSMYLRTRDVFDDVMRRRNDTKTEITNAKIKEELDQPQYANQFNVGDVARRLRVTDKMVEEVLKRRVDVTGPHGSHFARVGANDTTHPGNNVWVRRKRASEQDLSGARVELMRRRAGFDDALARTAVYHMEEGLIARAPLERAFDNASAEYTRTYAGLRQAVMAGGQAVDERRAFHEARGKMERLRDMIPSYALHRGFGSQHDATHAPPLAGTAPAAWNGGEPTRPCSSDDLLAWEQGRSDSMDLMLKDQREAEGVPGALDMGLIGRKRTVSMPWGKEEFITGGIRGAERLEMWADKASGWMGNVHASSPDRQAGGVTADARRMANQMTSQFKRVEGAVNGLTVRLLGILDRARAQTW